MLVGQRRIFSSFVIFLVDKSKVKNGRTISQRMRWKDIVPEFQKKTNLARPRQQLKHKYNALKLKGKETSLGWDDEKGSIAANDEWWLKQIEGIEPKLESKMDELFGGHVARRDDITTPNMDPLSTPMEEDEHMLYIPSQHHSENNINQPFNIENSEISILGPMVSTWLKLRHDDSPISTPPPVSQRVDGGGNGKGKRELENFYLDHNKSAKTNGPNE
ncbi:LOW QUALITY PROTEIN: hypothetical protein Cgig2_009642 [Carnegiea gigantea]|uniref:Myb/SANT-like domain-containing protein n=1 Tax=Carnegiea gigantea TaxID=171969 RepID=A0A9Q1JT83_9CARY|nr:LOW QUALITY PROTEIN: hypothetical protein Cgig2_009642 [Carnegiea gigantea]